MFKVFKFIVDFWKELGWKEYLKTILITILAVAIAGGMFYAASFLFQINTALGIVGIVAVLLIMIGIQCLIMKKHGRG